MVLFWVLFSALSFGFRGDTPPEGEIKELSCRLEVRKLRNGRLLSYQVDFYFNSKGEVISYYPKPNNRYLLTDRNGDLQIYNPDSNTVRITRLDLINWESSRLFPFVNEQSQTMGLDEFGMQLDRIEDEGERKVSYWEKPADQVHPNIPSQVRLVHEEGILIFMGYYLPDGRVFKKSFFSDYESVLETDLPGRILDITYIAEADSVVEDTRFVDYRVNESVSEDLKGFTIPDDAEIY